MESETKSTAINEYNKEKVRSSTADKNVYERRFGIGYDTGDDTEHGWNTDLRQFEGVHQHTNGVISDPSESRKLLQLKNSLKAAFKSASEAIS